MGDINEVCDTNLALGIGLPNSSSKAMNKEVINHDPLSLKLSFGLGSSGSWAAAGGGVAGVGVGVVVGESSKNSSSNDDEGDNNSNNNGSRKKLRLTKEQSFILEEHFKKHSTLNTTQKLNLATMLNLKPRQVEVWFQNRRARTKLKLTETDCEKWKKSCVELTEQNKRLKKEIGELQALKKVKLERAAVLMFAKTGAGAAGNSSVCPSCCRCWKMESERGNGGGEASAAAAAAAGNDNRVVLKPKQSGLKMHG